QGTTTFVRLQTCNCCVATSVLRVVVLTHCAVNQTYKVRVIWAHCRTVIRDTKKCITRLFVRNSRLSGMRRTYLLSKGLP
ncbi:molybdopterin oxidoreductase family protein, partial [Vibrio parahaemolyticus V-223/04]